MNNVQRVLLIDDDYLGFEETLREDFKQNQIVLHCCGTKDEAITILDSGINFDVVILDWYLEEQNHLLSLLVLKHLQNRCFIPVFIWSDHIANYQESLERGNITYPAQLIQGIAKDEVSWTSIQDKITFWFQNSLTAQISYIYRQQIRQSLENVFF